MLASRPDLDTLARAVAGVAAPTSALCHLDGLAWGLAAGGETSGGALLEGAALAGPREPAAELLAARAATLAEPLQLPVPLLPADGAPLAERVAGLAAWCRGVLEGLHAAPLAVAALAGNALEAYTDLDAISRGGAVGADADEEQAYLTLSEHARVALALLAAELAGGGGERGRAG